MLEEIRVIFKTEEEKTWKRFIVNFNSKKYKQMNTRIIQF